jgi:hypothetical protein
MMPNVMAVCDSKSNVESYDTAQQKTHVLNGFVNSEDDLFIRNTCWEGRSQRIISFQSLKLFTGAVLRTFSMSDPATHVYCSTVPHHSITIHVSYTFPLSAASFAGTWLCRNMKWSLYSTGELVGTMQEYTEMGSQPTYMFLLICHGVVPQTNVIGIHLAPTPHVTYCIYVHLSSR